MEDNQEISVLEFLMPDDEPVESPQKANVQRPAPPSKFEKAEADTGEVKMLLAYVSKLLKAA